MGITLRLYRQPEAIVNEKSGLGYTPVPIVTPLRPLQRTDDRAQSLEAICNSLQRTSPEYPQSPFSCLSPALSFHMTQSTSETPAICLTEKEKK